MLVDKQHDVIISSRLEWSTRV